MGNLTPEQQAEVDSTKRAIDDIANLSVADANKRIAEARKAEGDANEVTRLAVARSVEATEKLRGINAELATSKAALAEVKAQIKAIISAGS